MSQTQDNNSPITASAYVQNNKMCIMGLQASKWGPIPFSHVIECQYPDGAIDFGRELEPNVKIAIDESQKIILTKIEKEKMRLAVEELVDRTRAGDQNAAAMLVLVRKNALGGYPKAQLSLKYAKNYATRGQGKPNTGITQSFAAEVSSPDPIHVNTAINSMLPGMNILQGSVALANGPKIDKERVKGMMNPFTPEEKKQFINAFKNWRDAKVTNDVEKIGKCIGLARAIQMVRLPNTPISILSPRAGLELD